MWSFRASEQIWLGAAIEEINFWTGGSALLHHFDQMWKIAAEAFFNKFPPSQPMATPSKSNTTIVHLRRKFILLNGSKCLSAGSWWHFYLLNDFSFRSSSTLRTKSEMKFVKISVITFFEAKDITIKNVFCDVRHFQKKMGKWLWNGIPSIQST